MKRFGKHSIDVKGYNISLHYQDFKDLCDIADSAHCFFIEDMVFAGTKEYWLKTYVVENPNKKLIPWLIDRGLLLTELK